MCKIDFRMGENILRRFLMIPCAVLLRAHLKRASSIALVYSGRVRFDVLGDAL